MSRWSALVFLGLLAVLAGCSSSQTINEEERRLESAEVNAELGLRYMQKENYQLAHEKLLRALGQNPESVKANHYAAELYRRLKEYDKADRHFRIAIDEAKGDDALVNNYGVFLCERGRYDEAEAQFLNILGNPVYRQKAQLYENLGMCLVQKPDMQKAEDYFRKGLEINPKMPKSLAWMAQISYEKGSALSSRAYLQRYLELGRHTPETLWLGIRVEKELGDKNAVSSYSLQLMRLYPDSDEAKRYQELEQGE